MRSLFATAANSLKSLGRSLFNLNSVAVVLVAIATLIGLGGVGYYLVTAQDFRLIREQLEARTEALTGLRLTLNGPLVVPLSLIPKVELHDVVLSNPAFPDRPEIFRVARLEGDVDLLGLLQGELRLSRIEATGARLDLQIGTDGMANWLNPSHRSVQASDEWISLHQLRMEDMVVSYVDRLTGWTFEMPIDSLVADVEANSDPIKFELETAFNDRRLELGGTTGSLNDLLYGDAFPIDFAMEIEGVDLRVTGAVDHFEYGKFSDIAVVVAAKGSNLAELGDFIDLALPPTDEYSINGTFSRRPSGLTLSALQGEMSWQDHKLTFDGEIGGLAPLAGIDGSIGISGTDIHEIGHLVGREFPHTESYRGRAKISGSGQALSLSELSLEFVDGDLNAQIEGTVASLEPLDGIDVRVAAVGGDLAEHGDQWAIALPESDQFRVTGRLQGSEYALSALDLEAELHHGLHQLALRGAVRNLFEPTVFSLAVDVLGQDVAEFDSLFNVALPHSDSYRLSATVDRDGEQWSVAELDARATRGPTTLSVHGRIESAMELQGLDLTFALSTDEGAVFVPVLADLPPLPGNAVELEGRATGSISHLNLEELNLDIGNSYLTGNAALDWDDEVKISLNINGGLVNFIPYHDTLHSLAGEIPDGKIFSAQALDLEFLRTWNLELLLENVDLLPAQDYLFNVERLDLQLQDGVLTLNPLRIQGAHAQLIGSLRLDVDATPPRLAVNVELDRGELEYLLTHWGIEGSRGQVDLRVELDGELESTAGFAQTAEGTILVLVRDLILPRISLDLRTTEILLPAFPWAEGEKDPSIDCGMGRFTVADETLTTNFFFADGPEMTLTAAGTVDLTSETYDVVVSPRGKRQRWRNHNINVRLSGPLTDPQITTQTGSVVRFALESLGKYALLGPVGVLVPLRRARPNHPCVTSVEEVTTITD